MLIIFVNKIMIKKQPISQSTSALKNKVMHKVKRQQPKDNQQNSHSSNKSSEINDIRKSSYKIAKICSHRREELLRKDHSLERKQKISTDLVRKMGQLRSCKQLAHLVPLQPTHPPAATLIQKSNTATLIQKNNILTKMQPHQLYTITSSPKHKSKPFFGLPPFMGKVKEDILEKEKDEEECIELTFCNDTKGNPFQKNASESISQPENDEFDLGGALKTMWLSTMKIKAQQLFLSEAQQIELSLKQILLKLAKGREQQMQGEMYKQELSKVLYVLSEKQRKELLSSKIEGIQDSPEQKFYASMHDISFDDSQSCKSVLQLSDVNYAGGISSQIEIIEEMQQECHKKQSFAQPTLAHDMQNAGLSGQKYDGSKRTKNQNQDNFFQEEFLKSKEKLSLIEGNNSELSSFNDIKSQSGVTLYQLTKQMSEQHDSNTLKPEKKTGGFSESSLEIGVEGSLKIPCSQKKAVLNDIISMLNRKYNKQIDLKNLIKKK